MTSEPSRYPLELRYRGESYRCVGVDLVTGWWLAGAPDDMPGSACWWSAKPSKRLAISRQQNTWKADVLTRAVYVELTAGGPWTPMTYELVRRLGGMTDADDTPAGELACAYFSAIGWIAPDDPGYRECDLPEPVNDVLIEIPKTLEHRRALTSFPGPNTLSIVKRLAERTNTSVHRIWRSWWASDFAYEYRATLLQEYRDQSRGRRASDLPPEMAAIGVS